MTRRKRLFVYPTACKVSLRDLVVCTRRCGRRYNDGTSQRSAVPSAMAEINRWPSGVNSSHVAILPAGIEYDLSKRPLPASQRRIRRDSDFSSGPNHDAVAIIRLFGDRATTLAKSPSFSRLTRPIATPRVRSQIVAASSPRQLTTARVQSVEMAAE